MQFDKLTVTAEDKNSTNPVIGPDIVKKTFLVGGGDKDTRSDVEDIKCVFGGGDMYHMVLKGPCHQNNSFHISKISPL